MRSRWRCHVADTLERSPAQKAPLLFDIGAWSTERRFAHHVTWSVQGEDPGVGRGPDDRTQDLAVERLIKMRGGVVVGRGGTGKSEVLRRLVARLKAVEITVHVVAFTHDAAQNAEGGTILHELHANKRQKNVAICVDEASMVSLSLWAQLAKFHFTGAMFFVFGDWAGQFQPIEDQDAPREVEFSGFLHRLCRGNRIELRKFRRHPVSGRADQGHFDCVGSIYPRSPLSPRRSPARASAIPCRGGLWARCWW